MNKISTICLTVLGSVAIMGAVLCSIYGGSAVASVLAAVVTGCAGGIAGYTIGSKENLPTSGVI